MLVSKKPSQNLRYLLVLHYFACVCPIRAQRTREQVAYLRWVRVVHVDIMLFCALCIHVGSPTQTLFLVEYAWALRFMVSSVLSFLHGLMLMHRDFNTRKDIRISIEKGFDYLL